MKFGDYFDEYIYKYAKKYNIPYLGICLGMQAMHNNLKKIDNHYLTNHKIFINKNSKLYKIYKSEEITVNSRHKYRIDKLKNLDIAAYSSDDVIEAVEDKTKKFLIGVQWHPEDMNDLKLFEYFIRSCL